MLFFGGVPPCCFWVAVCAGFWVTATMVIVLPVTPRAVAPPFFSPSSNGRTHTGPVPTLTKLHRPYGLVVVTQRASFSAAGVLMPEPFGGATVPGAFAAPVADPANPAVTSADRGRPRARPVRASADDRS